MNEPRRSHYISRFYLRRFADHKRRIRVYGRTRGDIRTININNVAVRTGFYNLVDDEGQTHTDLEHLLGEIETAAAPALDRIVSTGFPVSREDRDAIAAFFATLVTRTPETRDSVRAMYDALHGHLSRVEGMDDQAVSKVFERSGFPVPSQNQDVRLVVSIARQIAPQLLARKWLLIRARDPVFVTSDHPVVTYQRDPDPLRGTGLGNADEVYVPIDPQHVLALVHPRLRMEEKILDATPANTLFLNHLVAANSYAYIFQNPGGTLLDPGLIPKAPKVLFELSGTESPVVGTEYRRWSPRGSKT